MAQIQPRPIADLADASAGPAGEPPEPRPVLDLVCLARQSSGDKGREIELLSLFGAQAGQLAARFGLISDRDPALASDLARMLLTSARRVGAMALAQACEAYIGSSTPEGRAQALAELLREIAAVRAAIADLLGR
jgi:hypothetical protein